MMVQDSKYLDVFSVINKKVNEFQFYVDFM